MSSLSSPEPDANLYISDYHENLAHIHAHLSGDDGDNLAPSYMPPTGYWTSAEKNAFFHALCIYSRLRPDLIADCIKTKTAVEVCTYIDALDEAAAQHSLPTIRRTLPCAMEVSEALVEAEEEAARILVYQESEWEEAAIERARDLEMKREEAAAKAAGGVGTTAQREAEFSDWKEMRQHELRRADALRRLNEIDLRAIESVLQNDDRTSGTVPTSAPQSPSQRLRSEPRTPSPSAQASIRIATSPVSIENVDLPSILPGGLSPASRRRYRKRLYMRRKRAEARGDQVVADVVFLKPGRKQREILPRPRPKKYNKAGKKNKSGNEGHRDHLEYPERDGDVDVDMLDDTEKNNRNALSKAEAVEEDVDNVQVSYRHPHISGPSGLQKSRANLQNVGIDASWLRNNGCGLINSRSLSKHMKTYRALDNASPSVVSGISADTLQFLNAHLENFVTDLCHRAIVSREQEAVFKKHTKVWHFKTKQVPLANVEHALEMMGCRALIARMKLRNKTSMAKRGHKEPDDASQDSGSDEGSGNAPLDVDEEARVTDHREMYPLLVRLPRHLYPSPPLDTRFHIMSSSTARTEDLLSLETDEEALLAELLEEEELDALDAEDEAAYEAALQQRD